MATLKALPNEVLTLIFKHFTATALGGSYDLTKDPVARYANCQEQWLNLANLCRTSKSLRSLAEPLLYQNYYKPDTVLRPQARKSFRNYLRTLIHRPDLARHVRTLHIGTWPHYGSKEHGLCILHHNSSFGPGESELDGSEAGKRSSYHLMSLYLTHLATLKVPGFKRGKLAESLEDGAEDAEITILLSLTTQVQTIEIAMPTFKTFEDDDEPVMFSYLLAAFPEGCILKHLTHLRTFANRSDLTFGTSPRYSASAYHGYPLSPLIPFLNVPSLFELEIEDAFEIDLHYDYPDCKANSSNLRHLSLAYCAFSNNVLDHLITRCSALESFTAMFVEEAMPTTEFSWKDLSMGLRNQLSLQHIEMSSPDSMDSWALYNENLESLDHSEMSSDPIEPFKRFPVLEHLSLDEDVLLGFRPMDEPYDISHIHLRDILPRQIEHFSLITCTMRAIPLLERLLVDMPEYFPNMRNVHIDLMDLDFRWPNDPIDEEMQRYDRVERLGKDFENAGIRWMVWEMTRRL